MKIRIIKIPSSRFALGGDLQTNGSDFSTGLVHINAGGLHSENPNEGVQMGVDQNGVPNLVEEGETVFNDYVYSNRIMVDDDTKKRYGINKKRQITFAELSKKLEKEASERPNDPISQAGLNASMSDLADAQEAEKMRLEAERAKEAFNSLSPEEQTALMQRVTQEEQMAEQAVAQQQMQQAALEQDAASQQIAENTEPNLNNISAEGGQINKFAPGGKINPYAYDNDWTGFGYYNPETGVYDEGYLNFVNSIKQDWVDRILAGQYGNMDRYLGANKDYKITPEEVIALATDKKYSDIHKAIAAAYKDYLAGLNSSAEGISEPAAEPVPVSEKGTQVYIATDKGIVPVDASTLDDSYTIEDFDGVKIARKAPQKVEETPAQTKEEIVAEETGIKPDLKKETYMGLFGPAVGLGMMSAGIGRPDYRELNAALTLARTAPRRAGYATIGDYLTYTPMDIWAEQNRLDANTRAADRALMAGNSPSRYAGILANNYNAQLASGDLYRKAVEYNDAKKAQVAGFDRGTNQYNADAFTRNSQFNAETANRANQFATSVGLNVAQQKMANEADWYNSLYGNVYGLFDRVNQWEKWKRDHNTVAQMYANGLAGVVDEDTPVAMGYVEKGAKGGKLRKKGKNDLTL